VIVGLISPDELARREVTHAARGQQRLHHLLAIGQDLRAAGTLGHARIERVRVQRILSQGARIDAIKRRGLVQPHEGASIVPVATRRVMPVHDDGGGIGLVDQGVNEGHADGAGAHMPTTMAT